MTAASDLVAVDLTESERRLLVTGLFQWFGPAECSVEMAVALGFADVADLLSESDRIRDAVRAGDPLSRWDWSRALLVTEVVFSSYGQGAAWDWSIVAGVSDEQTVATLRSAQRTLSEAGVLIHIGTRPTTFRGSAS